MATKDPFEAISAESPELTNAIQRELAVIAAKVKKAPPSLVMAWAREDREMLRIMLKQDRMIGHRLSALRDAGQSPTVSVVRKRVLELLQFQMKQNRELLKRLQRLNDALRKADAASK